LHKQNHVIKWQISKNIAYRFVIDNKLIPKLIFRFNYRKYSGLALSVISSVGR